MANPKVFVTRIIAQEAIDLLEANAETTVWDGFFPPPQDVLSAKAKECDGLLTMVNDRVDKDLLTETAKLKVVSNMATGVDNIDVTEATRLGILVGRTPGVLDKTCAEFAFALLLNAARHITRGDDFVRKGEWKTWHPGTLQGPELYGSTLGLVGCGAIGLEVAIRAKAFGMKILYYQRHRRIEEEQQFGIEYADNLDTLLQNSDFVSLHVPLTPDTYHLISEKQFKLMKQHALLINTSRGSVVDQGALYTALSNSIIAGAAIDVTEAEPITLNDPLLSLKNITITPHIASAGISARIQMALMAAENLLAALKGEQMPSCANPEVVQSA